MAGSNQSKRPKSPRVVSSRLVCACALAEPLKMGDVVGRRLRQPNANAYTVCNARRCNLSCNGHLLTSPTISSYWAARETRTNGVL